MTTPALIALVLIFLSCAKSNNPSAEDTSNGLMVPIGTMQTARAGHTATVLGNGNVLIAGGFAASTLASAEIYDTASKTFTKVGQMTISRLGHSATLLPDGQILIAGGYNGSYLSSTEIFDPQTQSFSAGPNLGLPRSEHTATVLPNGKILLAGGVGVGWSFLQSAELYDIRSKTFTPTGSMTTARDSHTATLLENGKVLVTGGHRDRRQNIKIYASAELYDPQTKTFTTTGSMSVIRHKHDAVALADGSILVNGGSDERDSKGVYTSTEIYDPATSSFRPAGNMNIGRYKHNGTSVLLPNGNILIAGGNDQAEIFQPASGKFSVVAGSLGTDHLVSRATLLSNGQVLLTGGYNEKMEFSANAWLYNYQ